CARLGAPPPRPPRSARRSDWAAGDRAGWSVRTSWVRLLCRASGRGQVNPEGALDIRGAGTETCQRAGVFQTDLKIRSGRIEQSQGVALARGKCRLRCLQALARLREEVAIDDAIRLLSRLQARLRVAQLEESHIPGGLQRADVRRQGMFGLADAVAAPAAEPRQVDRHHRAVRVLDG